MKGDNGIYRLTYMKIIKYLPFVFFVLIVWIIQIRHTISNYKNRQKVHYLKKLRKLKQQATLDDEDVYDEIIDTVETLNFLPLNSLIKRLQNSDLSEDEKQKATQYFSKHSFNETDSITGFTKGINYISNILCIIVFISVYGILSINDFFSINYIDSLLIVVGSGYGAKLLLLVLYGIFHDKPFSRNRNKTNAKTSIIKRFSSFMETMLGVKNNP